MLLHDASTTIYNVRINAPNEPVRIGRNFSNISNINVRPPTEINVKFNKILACTILIFVAPKLLNGPTEKHDT